MNRLIGVIVLLVAVLVGLGFYRGWFSVMWDSGGGKGHITGTMDEDKFKEDLQKVKNVGHQEKDKVAAPNTGPSQQWCAPMKSSVNPGWFYRTWAAIKRGLLGKSGHDYMQQFTGSDEYWDNAIAAQRGWPQKEGNDDENERK